MLDVDVPVPFSARWVGDAAAVGAGWEVVYQLRSADGQVASELISELDLASTLQNSAVGEAEEFWVSSAVAAGSYGLSLLVRDPWQGRGPLALGMDKAQADGSYLLGSIEVAAPLAERSEAGVEQAAEASLAAAATSEDVLVSAAFSAPEDSGPTLNTLSAAYVVYLPLLRRDNLPSLSTTVGKPRGYLTTPQELSAIKQKANQGKAPYAANVRELLNHSTMSSTTTWVSQSSLSGNVVCSDGSQKNSSGNTIPKGPIYLIEGSRLNYSKMLTAILKGGSSGESYARNARAHVLDLIDTTGWGGSTYTTDNQCILYLSWYLPGFIMAADLLEAYPAIWSVSDKTSFQKWLGTQIYPKVAWASRVRTNNWGSAGSYAAAVIADYMWDSGLTLKEVAPVSRSLTPGQAYREHTNEQLSRISSTVTTRDKQDSDCLPYKGIQPSGAVPDELRRASISNPLSMCTAKYLPSISGGYSSAYNYQSLFLEQITAHAELALRRGDKRLYNGMSDGSGSLLRGIKFILANPTNLAYSYDWDANRKAMLYVAHRFYRDSAINTRLYKGEALRSGHVVSFARLTHGFAAGETISSPPTVPPPQ